MKSLSVRDFLFLSAGFLISFFIFHPTSPPDSPPLSAASVEATQETSHDVAKKLEFTSTRAKEKLQKLKFKSLKTLKVLNKAKPSSQRKPTSASVVLSESNIRELEDHLYELRSLVQTHLTSEGWLLQGKVTRSPFSHFGFQSGDVIRHDSLDALKRRSDKFALAKRFESVLRSLER